MKGLINLLTVKQILIGIMRNVWGTVLTLLHTDVMVLSIRVNHTKNVKPTVWTFQLTGIVATQTSLFNNFHMSFVPGNDKQDQQRLQSTFSLLPSDWFLLCMWTRFLWVHWNHKPKARLVIFYSFKYLSVTFYKCRNHWTKYVGDSSESVLIFN